MTRAVIVAAMAGAFVGDHISYVLGRRLAVGEHGGLVLVIARYVPGGRTAVTLTMGAIRYPLRRFAIFDGIAAMSWAAYSGLVGYVGGVAFERNPLKGVLFAIGLALTMTVIVELIRHLWNRPTWWPVVR